MARAMWSGFLSFGLVNVPVGMFSATSDKTIHFNQLHKGTSNRVRYRKVDETTGEELEAEDIVSGYEVSDGEYVVVTKEELKEAAPEKTETIDISDFVDLKEIDPKYFKSTYYLAPKGKGAERAYALLRQAMLETNRVGIASVVIRDKEHLVAVRPTEDVLILETMFFQDEIRDPKEELDTLPGEVHFEQRELAIAHQLIDMLSTEWQPEKYKSTYREQLRELIERKREGQVIHYEAPERKSNVLDLMAALEQSVATTGKRAVRATAPEGEEPKKKVAAARSATATRHTQRAVLPGTKADLLRRAQEAGLEADESMTKAELAELLRGLAGDGRRAS